ncbi:MAG TPA: hypothetical protein VLK23_10635, partial [Thermodesulfobacteriota bacterium]|nr:hypothetical protein [Thermodesulfobacteriota bacterium]
GGESHPDLLRVVRPTGCSALLCRPRYTKIGTGDWDEITAMVRGAQGLHWGTKFRMTGTEGAVL